MKSVCIFLLGFALAHLSPGPRQNLKAALTAHYEATQRIHAVNEKLMKNCSPRPRVRPLAEYWNA